MDRITLRRRVPGLGGPGRLRALLVLGALLVMPRRARPGQHLGAHRQRGRRGDQAPWPTWWSPRPRPRSRASRWWSPTPPASTASRSCPPGTYTLRFEKETYRPSAAAGSRSRRTGRSASTSSCCRRRPAVETVTVVGTPPVVDVGSSTTGTSVDQDFVRNLAVSRPDGLGGANRSFDSLAATAPQAAQRRLRREHQRLAEPREQLPDRRPAVNDPGLRRATARPLTIEFIDEVNVITGGYMPEYGRTLGGVLSAVTKSGGNEFHGSVFGNLDPGRPHRRARPATTPAARRHPRRARPRQHLRLRRDARRLHHQGQAVVLRRLP